MTATTRLQIAIPGSASVSALLCLPAQPDAVYVFAHGAGAGMSHRFMEGLSAALAGWGIATLRFQFPFMERGSKRPDVPPVAHAAIRAAVAEAAHRLPGLPLFAGGKSFGGRMTSQAQALEPLPGVLGLAFVGFPLHPAGKPGTSRAEHLQDVAVPMLFLQGTRDLLAKIGLVQRTVEQLAAFATLHTIPDADHGFHVPVRSGRTDAQVVEELAETLARWMSEAAAAPR